MNASRKQLKTSLAPGVRKLGPASLASKLGEFPLFDDFLDLAKFLPFEFPNFDDFRPFDDFPDFLASSSPPPTPNPTTSPSPFPTSGPDTSSDLVVFSIEVSGATILLNPWMNRR